MALVLCLEVGEKRTTLYWTSFEVLSGDYGMDYSYVTFVTLGSQDDARAAERCRQ